jgi:hypothetical protein
MKVVINKCFGGFRLSAEAKEMLLARGCPHTKEIPAFDFRTSERDCKLYGIPYRNGKVVLERHQDEDRNCPVLVEVVVTLGEKANASSSSNVKVVEIPDDIAWEIGEYDGGEWVCEAHRRWE